jgi:hypothetical protein
MCNLTWVFLSLLTVFLSIPAFGQEESLTEEQLASIQLPMDPDDPVFEYDSFGGMRMAVPNDFEPTPLLRVFADGKIVTGGSSPAVKSCNIVLSEDQLNQFLHFVVNKQGFYEITKAELDNKMAVSGQQLFIADAPTSKFSVNLQRGSNSVEIYALSSAASTFSEIEEIQTLLEIQKKCRQLIAICNLGNEQQTNELLIKINQQMKAKHPDLAAFEAKDVRFATRYTDGKFQASFRKSFKETEDSPPFIVAARVKRPTADAVYEILISDAKNTSKKK